MEKYRSFIVEVQNYINRKKLSVDIESGFKGPYRVFLGIRGYPDKSNMLSSCGLYKSHHKKGGQVAFFSNKTKPEMLIVFAILFGSNEQAYKFVKYMNSNPSISWSDIIEYLAINKGVYFKNIETDFKTFQKNIGSNTVLYLLFSNNNKYISQVQKLQNCIDYANVIHPSSRNINTNTMTWFNQYVLNDFNGKINQSNLTYRQFQI